MSYIIMPLILIIHNTYILIEQINLPSKKNLVIYVQALVILVALFLLFLIGILCLLLSLLMDLLG